jgi:UDP-N-acetylglucosamine diphosphorylase/glucosamine-1-phosphate N-acetyltransferase
MVQVCIFEDNQVKNLYPLTQTRPVYTLRVGIKDLLGKIKDHLPESSSLTLHCRESLAEMFPYKLEPKDTLFINGRIIAPNNLRQLLKQTKDHLLSYNEIPLVAKVSAAALKKIRIPDTLDIKFFRSLKLKETKTDIPIATYYWDLIHANAAEIKADARQTGLLGKHQSTTTGAHLLHPEQIFIGENVSMKPGVVLDASDGPIFIDNQVELMPNTVVIGPAYIGFKSKIKVGAKIYGGTTIGPVCKVGGEIEGSIIQGYSNKQHEGFLGHSYLGEWVNLGAGTENSDLKNNYLQVSVIINNKEIQSQQTFVGCCIGDHTKTGIKTMITTGSVFGCFCNIFGTGYQPKYIPSFTWNNNDTAEKEAYAYDKAIQTAKAVFARRSSVLSLPQEKIYKKIWQESALERKAHKIA